MRVKNNSGATKVWAGQTLTDGQEYTLEAAEIPSWQINDQVLADVLSGDLLIGDSVSWQPVGAPAVAYLLETELAVKVQDLTPFAAKKIVHNGQLKSLFKRVHGEIVSATGSAYTNLDHEVVYPVAKFTGAEILGAEFGDYLDFTVHDDANNTYSGLSVGTYGANVQLNQFGFNVYMPDGFYQNTSNYDADLYDGMIVRCKFYNAGATKNIAMNVWLHEVKA